MQAKDTLLGRASADQVARSPLGAWNDKTCPCQVSADDKASGIIRVSNATSTANATANATASAPTAAATGDAATASQKYTASTWFGIQCDAMGYVVNV